MKKLMIGLLLITFILPATSVAGERKGKVLRVLGTVGGAVLGGVSGYHIGRGSYGGYYGYGYSPALRVTAGHMNMIDELAYMARRPVYRPVQAYVTQAAPVTTAVPVQVEAIPVFVSQASQQDIPTQLTFVNETDYLVSVFINRRKAFDLLSGGKETILIPKLLGTRIQGVAARAKRYLREGYLREVIFEKYYLEPEKDGSVIKFTMPN